MMAGQLNVRPTSDVQEYLATKWVVSNFWARQAKVCHMLRVHFALTAYADPKVGVLLPIK